MRGLNLLRALSPIAVAVVLLVALSGCAAKTDDAPPSGGSVAETTDTTGAGIPSPSSEASSYGGSRDVDVPELLISVPRAAGPALAAGWRHTVGLRTDGTVIATGDNEKGQCDVSEWRDVVAVSAGDEYTAGLRTDGTVVFAGSLNAASPLRDVAAISAGCDFMAALLTNGKVKLIGVKNDRVDVSGWRGITAVSAGYVHVVGLREDGTAVAAGVNSDGECDVGGWSHLVDIVAGRDHTVGLRKDGTVVATGSNYYGECDVSEWRDIVAVSAGQDTTLGLRKDGTVAIAGDSADGKYLMRNWEGIVAISAGNRHAVGLKADGTALSVGSRESGKCDVGCWQNLGKFGSKAQPPAAFPSAQGMRTEYLEVLRSALDTYGYYEPYKGRDDFEKWWDTKNAVAYADLVDFNNDGVLELMVCCFVSDTNMLGDWSYDCDIYSYDGRGVTRVGEFGTGLGYSILGFERGANGETFIFDEILEGGFIYTRFALDGGGFRETFSSEDSKKLHHEMEGNHTDLMDLFSAESVKAVLARLESGDGIPDTPPPRRDGEREDLYFVTANRDAGIYVRVAPSAEPDATRLKYIEAGDESVRLHWLGLSKFSEGYNWYNVRLPDGGTGWVRSDVVRVCMKDGVALDR